MLTRIVKMGFKEEHLDDFLENFNRNKKVIRNFPGCHHLELYRDKREPNCYFTYSKWEDEEALNTYRHSEVFKEIWGLTKTWFDRKPLAWSLENIESLP
ncbi:putative quinol monooxygenase [Robertkochia aurantiaca]|uniref:putative quinol monooxygenase n=1 Tax=Robertkochia aurantiaca TaxID=2873700 RepID=UPI001CCDC667|nr:antibiotic biosynthesis monooxygenase family protein [Robertkochia sp. 3YJGBD-33]